MTEIENWLVEYMREHGKADGGDAESLAEENYFERELLDSLGIVQMVVGIEDEFGVRLEAEQMQDPRFCTIRGLAQIVDEARA